MSDIKPGTNLSTIWWSKHHPPIDPAESYAGKAILITGANTGLGLEAATKFAALGASPLILAVRSVSKGQAAKAQIEAKTNCSPDAIHVVELDMASYASVEKFADTISRDFARLDAAVLNAGVAPSAFNLGPEGWEMSIQVNALSTAYLAILLLPKLRQTGRDGGRAACLEIVGSTGHADVKAETIVGGDSILGKANDKKNFSFMVQYILTKLFGMWVMAEVAAKTDPAEVVVLASCPGLCKSDLGREFNVVMRGVDSVIKTIFARTPEEGSRTLVSATTVGPRGHGGFWTHDQIAATGELMSSETGKKLQKQFWNEVIEDLTKQNPEIQAVLNG